MCESREKGLYRAKFETDIGVFGVSTENKNACVKKSFDERDFLIISLLSGKLLEVPK